MAAIFGKLPTDGWGVISSPYTGQSNGINNAAQQGNVRATKLTFVVRNLVERKCISIKLAFDFLSFIGTEYVLVVEISAGPTEAPVYYTYKLSRLLTTWLRKEPSHYQVKALPTF